MYLCHKCKGKIEHDQEYDHRILYGCGCLSSYRRDWQMPSENPYLEQLGYLDGMARFLDTRNARGDADEATEKRDRRDRLANAYHLVKIRDLREFREFRRKMRKQYHRGIITIHEYHWHVITRLHQHPHVFRVYHRLMPMIENVMNQ